MKKSLYLLSGLLLVLPLLTILYLSVVTNWSFPQLWQSDLSLRYWKALFYASDGLAGSFGLSLAISTAIATMATAFGFFLSKQLMFDSQQSRLIQLAYYPYVIAPVVFGSMLQFYFVRLGLTGSIAGVLFGQILFVFPYAVLLQSTFWNDRVKQTAFQATTLGASEKQLFQTVLFPMARPWLVICFVQCFLISWFEYGITQLIGVGKVATLTIKTMQFVKEANTHLAALSACLMVLPVIALLVINKKLFLKRADVL